MQKILRDYQQECLDTLRDRLRKTTSPLLVNASVGSGKSLILSELLLVMERAGYKALCLTMNSTLIQQNAETYRLQGGNPGIYCAGLGEKCIDKPVIFGSPHSISKGISSGSTSKDIRFNLIIVDECHNINHNAPESMYMRILNWYGYQAQLHNYKYRIVGLTGTPYRGKGISIVGPNEFFKEQVCDISTSWLIEQGYLTKPHFGITHVDAIDFSDCHVDSFGKFKHKDLKRALVKNERLTGEIMRELQTVKCNGMFIFASTQKHCEECARSLPDGQWAIITGDTSHKDRKLIIEAAREGRIKYLLSVNCLYVGIDIPCYDVCAWLRPTESLIIYTQGIGRVLRLFPGKEYCTILDYAGNLDRHGHIDDQIINAAIQPKENENIEDYPFVCYTCNTMNSVHARRCRGMIDNKRCEYFFEFKDCACGTKNDITSRQCRSCDAELIDPNAKLTRLKAETYTLDVIAADYKVSVQGNTSWPLINVAYRCNNAQVYESYFTNSKKSQNITYAKFIRMHITNASDYYMKIGNLHAMQQMLSEEKLVTPRRLVCTMNEYGFYKIVKKIFS